MNPLAVAGAAAATMSWLGSTVNDKNKIRNAEISYLFLVMVDFMVVGEFQNIDGLSREVETETIAEGGRNYAPHTKVKQGKNGTVTLKWGMMDRSFMWDWLETVEVGNSFRSEVMIIQFNRSFIPVRTFYLHGAFPTKVQSSSMDAGSSTQFVEEMQIVFDRIIPVIIPTSGDALAANLGSGLGGAAKMF